MSAGLVIGICAGCLVVFIVVIICCYTGFTKDRNSQKKDRRLPQIDTDCAPKPDSIVDTDRAPLPDTIVDTDCDPIPDTTSSDAHKKHNGRDTAKAIGGAVIEGIATGLIEGLLGV